MSLENAYRNIIYVHKIGERGVVLSAKLSDRNGPANLTGYTVTLNVKKGETPVVNNADCSGNATGDVTCTIDSDFDPLTKPQDYDAEFKAQFGEIIQFFPKSFDEKRTYFVFRAQESLDATPEP